ncbi:sodium:calcium antiporter [Candidatus Mycoplasma haematohominis]|uniref:sodium:calcium antiporter n=1 Tax=Candidatus Mycoplasma haematohominis TaxID=1494318 RepID=UPI001C0A6F11|nr:sodium:calcium antiporter [Candidatus Mycoplasma haemohominis]
MQIDISTASILFILCFLGILVTAFWAIEAIKAVSDKFKLSETFIGAVFLSVGTSFPEFVNSLSAGWLDRSYLGGNASTIPINSAESFYNITGANIWQVVFLAVVMIGLAIYYKIRKNDHDIQQMVDIFWKDSILSWKLLMLETTILIFIFSWPLIFQYLTVGGFSMLNLIFLGIWLFYIRYTYTSTTTISEKEEPKYFTKCGKPALVIITLSLWSLFGAFSCINFQLASKFPMDPSTSFGVLLSFVTSSPEFSVLYFLLKQKRYQMAVSGFFGSSLFNLTLPFYSNLISLNTIFGKQNFHHTGTHEITSQKITIWLLLNLILIFLFIFTFWNRKKWRTSIIATNGTIILTIYVVANTLLGYT